MTRIIGVTTLVLAFLIGMATAVGAQDVQLTTDLSGANAVGDPGDPEGSGSATVDINADTAEVCFQITIDGTEDPTAAHIHEGAADVAGGVVVDFDWATNASAGCVAGDADVVAAILADPGGYYVNVHTAEFPAGAARGQLAAASSGETELAQTGSDLTILLLIAGAVLVIAGAITRVPALRSDNW